MCGNHRVPVHVTGTHRQQAVSLQGPSRSSRRASTPSPSGSTRTRTRSSFPCWSAKCLH